MREDLVQAVELEYEQIRSENEREEARRREVIRTGYPEIHELIRKREELVFGTLREIISGNADTGNLPEQMESILAQIREKLKENGFPDDYLAPVYRCPICKDTGRTGEPVKEPCACFRRAYQRKLRKEIGLGTEKKESFETFDLSLFPAEKLPGSSYTQREYMAFCRDICKKWADNYPNNTRRDLLLTGNTGLGKTFLLRAMAERLIEKDVNVLIISAYRMFEILRKSYFDSAEDSRELQKAEVLMIDDLGSEPLMANITIEQLFNLLNERQSKGLSTVISTNLDGNKFRERYTERIASRLRDSRTCEVLSLYGTDIRTKGSPKA